MMLMQRGPTEAELTIALQTAIYRGEMREREACAQRLDDEADAFLGGQSIGFAKLCRNMADAIRARRSQ